MAARGGAPQGPRNSGSLLQAQHPAGLRGSRVGPGARRAHPFQQETRCGCKPTAPGEAGFPVKRRARGAAHSPSGSPQPLARPFLQAFREHSFFPEVDSPRCTSRELTGRWSLGLIRPGSPGGPGPLELGGHSQQTARASPGARESRVGRWAPGSRLHGAGWRAGAPASSLNPPSDCL